VSLIVDEKILVQEMLSQEVDKKLSKNIVSDFFNYDLGGLKIKHWLAVSFIISVYYRLIR